MRLTQSGDEPCFLINMNNQSLSTKETPLRRQRTFILIFASLVMLLGVMLAPFPTQSTDTPRDASEGKSTATVPSLLPNGELAIRIAVGGYHMCALTASNRIFCWGAAGRLGDGTAEINRAEPVQVVGLDGGEIKQIAAGDSHTCALRNDGKVFCWGYNNYGQLGDGSTEPRYVPSEVRRLNEAVTTISAGAVHTCAIGQSGQARCWGRNRNGELGDGTRIDRKYPVDVQAAPNALRDIVGGDGLTCAIATDTRAVKCWGKLEGVNENYAGIKTAPTEILDMDEAAFGLAVGRTHACALVAGGRVRCWGDNSFGQLGNGGQTVINVVQVENLSNAQSLYSGHGQNCVIMTDGTAKCWGMNMSGQLGNGNPVAYNIPQDVIGLTGRIVQMGIGRYVTSALDQNSSEVFYGGFACALFMNGAIKCWGNNAFGQLGNGTVEKSLVPVGVIGFDGGNIILPPPVGPPTATPVPTASPTPTATPLPTPTPRIGTVYVPLNLTQADDTRGFFVGPNEVEPNDGLNEANGPLVSGLDYYGLANDARDIFYIEPTQAGEIGVSVTDHSCPNLRVQLLAANSLVLADDRLARGQISYVAGAAGRYFIAIANGTACNQRAPYQIKATYR